MFSPQPHCRSKHLKASCNAPPRFCSPPFKLCGLRSGSDLHLNSLYGQKNRLLPVSLSLHLAGRRARAAQIIHVIVVPLLANALIDEPRKPLKYALFEVASPTILVQLMPRRPPAVKQMYRCPETKGFPPLPPPQCHSHRPSLIPISIFVAFSHACRDRHLR